MIGKASLLVCFIAAASALQAGPITYNLSFNFTDGGGDTLPTAGRFIYDSSLVSNPFSSFTVTEGGLVFDLTSAANGFTGDSFVGACKNARNAAGLFSGMTGAGCEPSWSYLPDALSSQFQIVVCASSADVCWDGNITSSVAAQGTGEFAGSAGLFTVTATPEPGAFWFSGIGVLALASRVWARRKRLAETYRQGSSSCSYC